MPARRRRAEAEEPHVSHERWLITYADMITLLMVLFIVLFAISQVDQKRFDMLKNGMAAAFGQTASPFQGTQQVMPASGDPMTPVLPETGAQPEQVRLSQPAASATSAVQHSSAVAEAQREVQNLSRLRHQIAHRLAQSGYRDDVTMRIDESGLRISLVSRHIVFDANLAVLTPRGARVLDVLAPVLRRLPNQIEIDGHTNQVKVKPKFYPTDWELSAARAVTVLRYLDEQGQVPGARLDAVAYGHERPLIDPSKPTAMAMNKRVDIVVLSSASEDARKLFREVMGSNRPEGRHTR
ncbi:MAG TPA: flagellar motor protein MotB [Nocardioidaceae bacterium]|nr:flagellar motor protein MotB [Nocardioidaceae bacterium]